MKVVLTADAPGVGKRPAFSRSDCACDCDCACPVEGVPPPLLPLPVAYYLELTPACNNRCPGCGNVYSERRPALPRPLGGAEWCAVIDRLAGHTHELKLTGGEATLHPAFARIVGDIDGHGIPFALFTNGRWAQPGALLGLLKATATCEGLLISLHGPDARSHESFSGVPGSFEETAANIRRAAEAGLPVATSMVIGRSNWSRVEETLHLALSLGANHVVCNRFIGDAIAGVSPTPEQLRAAMRSVESMRAQGWAIRFGNCIPHCFQASSSTGCSAGSTFVTVDPWGRVRPCNHTHLIAGDLRTQSVEEVWRGDVLRYWRFLVPAQCTGCAALAACHGGCRAQALLSGLDRDPLLGRPLAEAPALPEAELELYEGLRPVGLFTRYADGHSDVLIYRGKAVPVPADCAPLAHKLDGTRTLSQIETEYGGRALDWVGTLYENSMITWA